MLQVGDKAPDFTLRASDKSQVRLKDLRGKNVVLLFYPVAFSGVCTKELCMVRDQFDGFKDLDAELLAISVDSLFTLHKWKEMEGFEFTLLSDFNKKVCKKYDACYTEFVFEMKGVAKRSAFVVDANGIIQYAEVLDNAGELPNFEEVKKTLETLN